MLKLLLQFWYLISNQYEKTDQAQALDKAHNQLKQRIIEASLIEQGWTIFPVDAFDDEQEAILENYLEGGSAEWYKK